MSTQLEIFVSLEVGDSENMARSSGRGCRLRNEDCCPDSLVRLDFRPTSHRWGDSCPHVWFGYPTHVQQLHYQMVNSD